MMLVIYPILNGKEGRKRGEYPLGTLSFGAGGCEIDIPDRKVASRVRSLLSETFSVRVFAGSGETFMAHRFEQLEPGDERHFDEALRRLICLDLLAVDESAGRL